MRVRTIVAGAMLALLVGASPSRASVTTDDFVAILGPSADYLAASSDLAATAGSRRIRGAARAQAASARALLADLAAWRQARA